MAATTAALALGGAQILNSYQNSVGMGIQAQQEELVSEINAGMMKIRGEQALEQGKKDLEKFNRQVNQFKGTQKAVLAASGVSTESGSALEIQKQTDLFAAEDQDRIKNNAALQAWGYKTESVNTLLQGKYKAEAYRNQATGTLLGGIAQAGATVYGGTGKMKAPSDSVDFGEGTTTSGGTYNPSTYTT